MRTRLLRPGLPVAMALALCTTVDAGSARALTPDSCPNDGDRFLYTFSNVSTSTRPTDLFSAYITGPGTITFNESKTATVGASATASVTAEAGIVFAKASATTGVSVEASRSWTDGFAYTLSVPAGQRRRMRLYEESRAFLVTKRSWNSGACSYANVVYSNNAANAPRVARIDEWKLEA